eukprot:TRINITY_DN30484_c0_g1_i1.p1 TRINITY_DN30484_c0_g1~~TRINITY_DN30484_c0_g1_i1.p1  ORF type:complete len:185 (-),score=24.84 TRINITY_DN30484_c0_g1_i1:112-666(-)
MAQVRSIILSVQGSRIVTFGGDIFFPSLLSSAHKGAHLPPLMNKLPVDVAVVGNHEFDMSSETHKLFAACNFPWLLANVLDENQLLRGVQTHTMIYRGGINFGFIGVAEEQWIDALELSVHQKYTYIPFTPVVKKYSEILRQQGHPFVDSRTCPLSFPFPTSFLFFFFRLLDLFFPKGSKIPHN